MKLPSYQDLDPEQDKVLNIPLDKSCLVTGPPGTGKTLVALFRSQTLNRRRERNSYFIVYNVPLKLYLQRAFDELEIDANVNTFHSWFANLGRQLTGKWIPTVGRNRYNYDWEKFLDVLPDEVPARHRHKHVILDEAQDFNAYLFRFLPWLSDHYSIFADENQRITENNCTLDRIRKATKVTEYKLTRNYRNSMRIHDVAVLFYAGLNSGMAARPTRDGPMPTVFSHMNLESQIRQIAQYERTNSDLEIGVLVPRVDLITAIKKGLEEIGTRNPVQYYHSGVDKKTLSAFDGPGIRLLTYMSVKGLEFDTVFLPCLEHDGARLDLNNPLMKMQFYVLITRARDGLFFLWQERPSAEEPTILAQIPEDLAHRRSFGTPGDRTSPPMSAERIISKSSPHPSDGMGQKKKKTTPF